MRNEKETRLKLPGPWIEHPDRNWAFRTRMLLDAILDELDEAQLVLRLFQEASGGDPLSGDFRLRRLYAKSFVYALDATSQFIGVLKSDKQLPVTARAQCERFLSEFGMLRDLRNSLHHIEDRLRGFGRDGKNIPTSLLVLSSFRDNNFGATSARGGYVEIEVSDSILLRAFAIVEDLIWCFDWLGAGNTRILRLKAGA